MTPESLLAQFDVMAEAPNGVEKLRELVLQLAVRGKLVPQDPADEPASVLLEHARLEQSSLIARKEIPQPKLAELLDEQITPHAIPNTWSWVRLGQIVAVLDSRREPVKEGDRASRTAGKAASQLFPYYGATQQVGWIDDFLFDEELLLLGEDGAPFFRAGKNVAYVVSGKTWVNNHAHVMRGLAGISNRYLCHALNVADFHGYVAGTTRQKLTQGKMVELPIALPPLAEQHRIVAKIDELMALCDQLEARQRRRAALRAHLNRSALHALTSASGDVEVAEQWQRLSEHFDSIFHAPETVAEFRHTITELAVRGLLVSRGTVDEDGTSLLARIRPRSTAAQRRPRSGALSEGGPIPFRVPATWVWARVGELSTKIGSGSTPLGGKQGYTTEGVKFLRSQNVWNDGLDLDGVALIPSHVHERMASTTVRAGDLLLNITGASIGRCAVVPDNFDTGNVSQHVSIIRPVLADVRRFLHLALISPAFQQAIANTQVGISREGLSIGRLAEMLVPLPPLAEQHRIVARVDELMALCDALEARLTSAREHATQLAAAIVHRLTAA